ncbi:zinc finger transcription factor, putative [Plasmodium malariae]|uniref:Zinc finger transcription factor, putative n=1 Tax=Plasmodium malariae TaxID=5858 RepID=A0A1D3TCG0_PLAMA|nr:zinc finger transcription factor, putative [Plasmodium malariae]SCP02545.1 zinc finger transcription factor, putative [Plasmodium malariae]
MTANLKKKTVLYFLDENLNDNIYSESEKVFLKNNVNWNKINILSNSNNKEQEKNKMIEVRKDYIVDNSNNDIISNNKSFTKIKHYDLRNNNSAINVNKVISESTLRKRKYESLAGEYEKRKKNSLLSSLSSPSNDFDDDDVSYLSIDRENITHKCDLENAEKRKNVYLNYRGRENEFNWGEYFKENNRILSNTEMDKDDVGCGNMNSGKSSSNNENSENNSNENSTSKSTNNKVEKIKIGNIYGSFMEDIKDSFILTKNMKKSFKCFIEKKNKKEKKKKYLINFHSSNSDNNDNGGYKEYGILCTDEIKTNNLKVGKRLPSNNSLKNFSSNITSTSTKVSILHKDIYTYFQKKNEQCVNKNNVVEDYELKYSISNIYKKGENYILEDTQRYGEGRIIDKSLNDIYADMQSFENEAQFFTPDPVSDYKSQVDTEVLEDGNVAKNSISKRGKGSYKGKRGTQRDKLVLFENLANKEKKLEVEMDEEKEKEESHNNDRCSSNYYLYIENTQNVSINNNRNEHDNFQEINNPLVTESSSNVYKGNEKSENNGVGIIRRERRIVNRNNKLINKENPVPTEKKTTTVKNVIKGVEGKQMNKENTQIERNRIKQERCEDLISKDYMPQRNGDENRKVKGEMNSPPRIKMEIEENKTTSQTHFDERDRSRREHVEGGTLKGASQNVPQDVSQNVPQDVSQNVPQDVSQNVPQDVSQNVPKDVSQNIPQDISQNVPQDVSQNVPKDVSQNIPQDISQNVPQDVSQNVPKDVSQNIPQDISQNVPQDVSQNVPRDVPEDAAQRIAQSETRNVSFNRRSDRLADAKMKSKKRSIFYENVSSKISKIFFFTSKKSSGDSDDNLENEKEISSEKSVVDKEMAREKSVVDREMAREKSVVDREMLNEQFTIDKERAREKSTVGKKRIADEKEGECTTNREISVKEQLIEKNYANKLLDIGEDSSEIKKRNSSNGKIDDNNANSDRSSEKEDDTHIDNIQIGENIDGENEDNKMEGNQRENENSEEKEKDNKDSNKTITSVKKENNSRNNVDVELRTCNICNMVFANNKLMQRHVMSVHSNERPYECEICLKRYKRADHLKLHRMKHDINKEEKKFQCSICQLIFKTSRQSYNCKLKHLKDSKNNCSNMSSIDIEKLTENILPLNNDSFEKRGNEITDMAESSGEGDVEKGNNVEGGKTNNKVNNKSSREKEGEKSGELQCSNNENNMNNELENIEERNTGQTDSDTLIEKNVIKKETLSPSSISIEIRTCNVCNMVFANKKLMKRHLMCVHSDSRPYKCELCIKTYKRSDHLKKHILTHKDNKEKVKYNCLICQLSFDTPKELRTHKIRHYTCPYENCSYSYSTISKMKYHLNKHKCNLFYSCPACEKKFLIYKEFIQHKRNCFKKKYVCLQCNKIYLHINGYNKHVKKVHLNICQNYKCTINNCSKEFSSEFSLKEHVINFHHHVKRFFCSKCNMSFGYRSSFRRHNIYIHS